MEKFGSSILLDIRYIKIDTFESTLECIQSFTEVTIDFVYLNQLSMHCKHLRKLVISLPFKVDEKGFVCLSKWKDLKELVLTGCIKQDLHYPLSQYCTQLSITVICDILKNTKPISKIQFAFIEILEKLSILGECGNGSFSLGKLTSEAKHITEWHLHSVTSCQLFNFPSAIKLLNYSDADCVSLEKLKKSSIETLVLKNLLWYKETWIFTFKNFRINWGNTRWWWWNSVLFYSESPTFS